MQVDYRSPNLLNTAGGDTVIILTTDTYLKIDIL
jgi:hypothetical protein